MHGYRTGELKLTTTVKIGKNESERGLKGKQKGCEELKYFYKEKMFGCFFLVENGDGDDDKG